MQVKFWGVRGSTPTPQAENLRYGGNTSCVEVRVGDQIYIFDCGTGFRVLGHALESEFGSKPFSVPFTTVRKVSSSSIPPAARAAWNRLWSSKCRHLIFRWTSTRCGLSVTS